MFWVTNLVTIGTLTVPMSGQITKVCEADTRWCCSDEEKFADVEESKTAPVAWVEAYPVGSGDPRYGCANADCSSAGRAVERPISEEFQYHPAPLRSRVGQEHLVKLLNIWGHLSQRDKPPWVAKKRGIAGSFFP